MHAVALHVIRTAHRPITRRACRIIAGSRRPLPHRSFHRSPISYQIPEDPAAGPSADAGKESQTPDIPEFEADETKLEDDGAEGTKTSEVGTPVASSKVKNGRGPGRLRGVHRQKQPEGLPPIVLPEWFWKNNVKCATDPKTLSGSLAVYGSRSLTGDDQDGIDASRFNAEIAQQIIDITACELETTEAAKYSIHVDVYREILATLRAGLALRPPKNTGDRPIPRPVTLLQCPKDGGSYYLDSVVETIASKLGADLVRLDAQDLAQIAGPYVEGNLAWHYSKTGILAYSAHRVAGKLEEYDKELDEEQDDVDAEEEDEAPKADNKSSAVASFLRKSFIPGLVSPFTSRTIKNALGGNGKDFQVFATHLGGPAPPPPASPEPVQWNDLKMTAVLEALINAPETAPTTSIQGGEVADAATTETNPRPLIIQIRDYKEISGVPEGLDLLYKFRSVVNKKWQEGKDIILVGTTSTEEQEPALSRPEIQHLQSDIVDGEKRTIFVPPDRREQQDIAFESDEKARIRSINIRNIEDMILKLADGSHHATPKLDIEKDIDSAIVFSAGLEDAVWTYARVHRTAMLILGLETSISNIDGAVLSKALKVLSDSDNIKFAWGAAELKQEDDDVEVMLNETETVASEKKKGKDKLKEIRKKCTPHEVKLLSGVVLASDIRTTFADIRAPKETVEALKTLTSLSLIRPEAFSYGVLATDKIPGLLLYGPPGTGKTLLAKAVAKESGATVLEVTAADLNDMFVGQGEKNVRAVFTLAKKLSPCVVFIDEADAIFSARGEHNRNAHREMINQFLREWDGMNDFSAFIMVATNRPFDLDEAVLRRLPRRLLVDLPVEKDREAILKIHLKDEIIDDSVSLAKLAKETPFYSGSDLKNLSVAAALACIREENTVAAQHTGEEPYVYPEKRILTKAHFDKAMEEISASISEDMSTLTAIRKFDEKYGDRKGRKKKGPGLGFGGTTLVEKDSEAARVRKMEAV